MPFQTVKKARSAGHKRTERRTELAPSGANGTGAAEVVLLELIPLCAAEEDDIEAGSALRSGAAAQARWMTRTILDDAQRSKCGTENSAHPHSAYRMRYV